MTLINASFVDGRGWVLGVAVGPESHDPEWGVFNVDVPDGVWTAYVDALQATDLAREQLMVATGLAAHAPRRLTPCGSFLQTRPDPQKFMADRLSRRCQTCRHFARDHAEARAVA